MQTPREPALLSFGIAFISCGIVSFKASLWGYARWKVYLPDNPVVHAAILIAVVGVPWLLVAVRLFDAATEHGISVSYGADEEEADKIIWQKTDEVLERSLSWMWSTSAHAIGSGIIGGGLTGVSIVVIKIVPSVTHWLVLAAGLAVNLSLLVMFASAYWSRVAKEIASGLSEHLDEMYPWMGLGQSDDDET